VSVTYFLLMQQIAVHEQSMTPDVVYSLVTDD